MKIEEFFSIVLAVVACGATFAKDRLPFPKDVPPVFGMAVISDLGKEDARGEWKIILTVPKVEWELVGKMVPKTQFPELKSEVEKATITLRIDGPSQLVPSQIVDMKGKELDRDEIVKRLEKETPVLVSVSGRMPDAYYLQLTNPDALIVILRARDGYPAPGLLPAKKASSAQPKKEGDK